MMALFLKLPPAVIYAGMAGVLLALIVATAQNRWQWRVFALLALRLAIGWHFLFEGLHKINSTIVGDTATNKPFTSAPYFAAGEGPFADIMRKEALGDTEALIASHTAKAKELSLEDYAKLSDSEKADLCPAAVADKLTAGQEEARKKLEAELEKADDAKQPQIKANLALLENNCQALRVAYADWLYGFDRRPATLKSINDDVPSTAQDRIQFITLLQKQAEQFTKETEYGLGNGDGTRMKRAAEYRTEVRNAKSALAKDIDSFIAELRSGANLPKPEALEAKIKLIDTLTRYTIAGVGACLLLGLFTRLACTVGIGFLALTYLSHPTVPWLPLPPGTEGNPLFINKNIIEALGLFVILVHPTGRWLGLDALIDYLLFKERQPKAQ